MIRLASAPPGAFVARPERMVKWGILAAGLVVLLATLMGLTLEVAAIGVLALVHQLSHIRHCCRQESSRLFF